MNTKVYDVLGIPLGGVWRMECVCTMRRAGNAFTYTIRTYAHCQWLRGGSTSQIWTDSLAKSPHSLSLPFPSWAYTNENEYLNTTIIALNRRCTVVVCCVRHDGSNSHANGTDDQPEPQHNGTGGWLGLSQKPRFSFM